MEPGKLKQRLVGAAVLVSAAVIVLSITLQSPDEISSGFESEVIPPKSSGLSVKVLPLNVPERVEPPKPEPEAAPADVAADTGSTPVDVIPIPDVAPAVEQPAVEQPAAGAPASAQPKPAPEATRPPPVAKAAAGAPEAWVVQLGSFTNRDNAFALRDKLRKRRYAAFVDDVGSGKKKVYRVRVGPELLRSRADALRDQIQKEFKLKGIVVTHEVN